MTTPSLDVTRITVALILLLALKGVHATGWGAPASLSSLTDDLVSTLSNRELNKEAREAMTAGYYEGLINEGSRVSSMNRLITGSRRITFEDREQPDRRESHDFRFYELIPNSDIPDYRDGRFRYRLRTNSAGLADREYSVTKPPAVRRIALFGDSITRGQGAPFQGTYEALLEDRLNEVLAARATGVEILNFAVGSYNLTQMLDTAIEKATPFEPDVYVVAMSKLSVYRSWGQHIALLLYAGMDMKYDYLRTLVREAGLRPQDSVGTIEAKLARHRLPAIRWVLSELQAHARKNGADVAVLLVPNVEEVSVLHEEFLGVREILDGLGIDYVDLMDTFARVDQAQYWVAQNDRHPNAAGHQRLYEGLYEKLASSPQLQQRLLGSRGMLD